MSEQEVQTVETSAEELPAVTEETPATTEETPATTEETPAVVDDEPAVTEVTEVTIETTEEDPKSKEDAPKEKPKEEKPKKEPKKKAAAKPPKDYRTSKAAWVERQGLIFKKWQRLYLSLDEEDSVLRWWKTDNRTGSDGAIFMKFCADVGEPKPEATTTWPENTADRCFVVCTPFRAHYMVAETVEDKTEWIQKLTAAKEKYNTEGRKVVSTELFATAAISAAFESGAADADKTLKEEGITNDEPKTESAAATTEGETTAPAAGDEVAAVTIEVEVETTEEPTPKEDTPEAPKPAEDVEAPVEEAPKEDTPVEEPVQEAPKDEPVVEDPPKNETAAEEPSKDETPAAAEGGETEVTAED